MASRVSRVTMEYNVEIPMPQDEHAGLRAEIMRSGGLSATVPLSSPDAAMRLLAAARVASVDAREVYFSPASGWAAKVIAPPIAGQRDAVAVSPRNETAACALVLELLTDAHQRAPGAAAATLEAARALCDAALAPPLGTADVNGNASVPTAAPPADGGIADATVAWLRADGGVGASSSTSSSKLSLSVAPARFPGTGRGAAASADIPAGEIAAAIPAHRLFTVEHALTMPGPRGDAYRMFTALGEDTVAALWLVAERALGTASPWHPLIASLPWPEDGEGSAAPCGGATPVSWPREACDALLGGTPLLADARAASEKLTRQHAALFPALSEHMSDVFPAQLYTVDNFRRAHEAWNSYGMTVQADPGTAPVTCLPPVAMLCNHALWPHVVRYSRLRDGTLRLPLARSIKAGEEVFVSYGAKSNAELLLFYGFALQGNPYDDVPLSLELPSGEVSEVTSAREAALQRAGLTLSPHAVRAGPLPLPLVGALRVLTADVAALQTYTGDPSKDPISSEGESAAARALCGVLGAMVEQLEGGDAQFHIAVRSGAAAKAVGREATEAAGLYRDGVRSTLDAALGEARRWRAAVGGGPDPALGKRMRD